MFGILKLSTFVTMSVDCPTIDRKFCLFVCSGKSQNGVSPNSVSFKTRKSPNIFIPFTAVK